MKKLFLTVSIFIVSITLSFAENFHLITVTQRDAGGENVGAPKDEVTISAYAQELAIAMGATLKIHSYGIDEFRSSTIEQLGIRPEDVVWFNYSGHSGTYDGFPMAGRVKQTEIYNLLRAKAKFTLATWDGCNINSPVAQLNFYGSRTPSMTQNVRRLFQASEGGVIAAASQTGKPSWGSKELGGIFTNSFVEAIRRVIYESDAATWAQVKAKAEQITQQTARAANKEQSPKIVLHIGRQVQSTATHNAPAPPPLHIVTSGETYESIAIYYRKKYKEYANLTATLLISYNNGVHFKEGAEIFLIH
jgi:hypothetical protein